MWTTEYLHIKVKWLNLRKLPSPRDSKGLIKSSRLSFSLKTVLQYIHQETFFFWSDPQVRIYDGGGGGGAGSRYKIAAYGKILLAIVYKSFQ